jgi:hypothetical protein
MAREATLSLPFEIPRKGRTYDLKCYLTSLVDSLGGAYGRNGEPVGIGFTWTTMTGLGQGNDLYVVSRRLQRALRNAGVLSPLADTYFLTQRVKHIRDGEPEATLTMKED